MWFAWYWGLQVKHDDRKAALYKTSALVLCVVLGLVACFTIPSVSCHIDAQTNQTLHDMMEDYKGLLELSLMKYGPNSDLFNDKTPDGGMQRKKIMCYNVHRKEWKPCVVKGM
jgi:hypothetical protein